MSLARASLSAAVPKSCLQALTPYDGACLETPCVHLQHSCVLVLTRALLWPHLSPLLLCPTGAFSLLSPRLSLLSLTLCIHGPAGRAAEELIYGEEDLSTINHGRLAMARRIVTKLVVSEVTRAVIFAFLSSRLAPAVCAARRWPRHVRPRRAHRPTSLRRFASRGQDGM